MYSIRALGVLAIAANVVLAAYWGSLGFPLVFDDAALSGLAEEPWLFAPRWLSYGTFTVAAGLDLPLQRAVNILVHAGTAAAIFALLRELLRHTAPAAAAAALFALHPVAVYGVAYLAQRSILLATLFSVLALFAWLKGLRSGRAGWLAASVAFYALALLSKEHAVMLPAVAIALLVADRAAARASAAHASVALAAMALLALWAAWSLRQVVGGAYEPHVAEIAVQATSSGGDVYARSLLTQAALFFRYVATWLCPLPGLMSVDLRVALVPDALAAGALAGAAAFLAWGAIGAALLVCRPLAGLAMLTPWLLFMTEFAAVRLQEPLVLYRSYLWGIGLPFLVAGLLGPLSRRAIVVATLAIAVPFTVGLRDRLATFESHVALWDDAVRKLPSDALPFADRPIGNRGTALLREGRHTEALADLDRAIALNPRNARALSSRGSIHAIRGDAARAIDDFGAAIREQPTFPGAYVARCGVRVAIGDVAGARSDCAAALAQQPGLALAHVHLGVLAYRLGEHAAALQSFDQALAIEPGNAIALHNMKVVYERLERDRKAL